jgi:ABC-2 type transport system ATP-binding protein
VSDASKRPLLCARAATLGIEGARGPSDLSFETTGDRLFVAGHAGPLFSALMSLPEGMTQASNLAATGELCEVAGPWKVVSGALEMAGLAVGDHLGAVGAAPLDPPHPPRGTVGEYLDVRLALKLALRGERASDAERQTRIDETTARAGLSGGHGRALKTLSYVERRVLEIASAMVARPEVVVLEQPLASLDGQGAEYVRGAIEAASHVGRVIVSGGSLAPGSPEGALARSASDFLLLSPTGLVAFGPPGEVLSGARVFRVEARTRGAELRARLEAAGAKTTGGDAQFTVAMPEGGDATLVLRMAHEVQATVVLVLPLL